MGLAQATRLIKLEEGRRLTAYKDSRGVWTIGDGYNLEAHGYAPEDCEGMAWTAEQADAALVDEIQTVLAELDRRWPKWRDLDEVRQAAIVSSVYQLGAPGASKFFATIHAIQERDFETAAKQMLASRWAKQTPARVQRNAEMIRSGLWPQEVNGVPFAVNPTPVPTSAPIQPPAPVLPPDRLPDVPGDGTTMGDAVRAVGVPAVGAVSVGGVVLSKKLCTLAGACAVVMFGPQFGLHLDAAQIKALGDMIVTYLAGQSAVDTLKPIIAPFMPAISEWLRGCSASAPTGGKPDA